MKLSDIKLNPKNPRLIKSDKFKKLVQSIKEDSWLLAGEPIIIDETGMILAGNMRYKALLELEYKEVPDEWVKQFKDLDDVQKRKVIMKTNISYGEDDWDILANEWDLDEIEGWGKDIPDFARNEEVEEDEAPEVSTEPAISKLGEIYQLGRHMVMCGDSTVKRNIDALMGGVKADMVFTDPPYGVDYKSKKLGSIMNDQFQDDVLYQFILDSFVAVKDGIADTAGIYCWYEDKFRSEIQSALKDAGYKYKQNLVWNKGMNLSGADYQKAHENCLYLQVDGSKADWYGGRDKKTILGQRRKDLAELKKSDLLNMVLNMQKESTVWDIDRDTVTRYVHPTQKPVGLCARAIYNSSNDGDVVIDTFLGSGSTLIACEQTNRTCYGMELDPKYVDVIRKRWAKFVYPDKWESEWEALTPAI